MHQQTTRFGRRSGAALLTALAMLTIFTLMGTAYLGYMTIESRRAALLQHQVTARAAAQGGIEAAIGEVAAAVAGGAAPRERMEFAFPHYIMENGQLAQDESRGSAVTVTVTDESARLNLNFAPRSALESLLGIDRAAARAIVQSLPHSEGGELAGGRWLSQVDDLVARSFVRPEVFEKLNPEWVTVYTVENKLQPQGYLNVNTASPAVLSAVLNVPPQQAEQIAAARPFSTMEQFLAAVGQAPTQFNIPPDPAAPDQAPAALALHSRCFRLRCEARLKETLGDRALESAPAFVEAVVLFPQQGPPEIRYWATTAPEA